MVQPKNKNATNKKPKPRRQRDGVKKHGKQTDIEELRVQLDALGLKIVEVTADGNCFFRIIVKILSPLLKMRFHLMSTVGQWKRMEHGQAIWNFKQLLLLQGEIFVFIECYHDGEHYNSVRLKEDSCEGPARPVIIKVDAHISRKDHNDKATTNKSSKGSSCRSLNGESVLQEVDGDVDAAIEFLIAEQDMDLHENADSNNDRPKEKDLVQGEGQSQEPGLPEVASADLRLEQNEKQGKKDCSCKSKTKCQACSTSTGKTSPSVDNKRAFNKGKRETKQNKRKAARKQVKESGSGPLPDMGALCI